MLLPDHHDIDKLLDSFANSSNVALKDSRHMKDHSAQFLKNLEDTGILLNRHLTDEEELIVPIILKRGTS